MELKKTWKRHTLLRFYYTKFETGVIDMMDGTEDFPKGPILICR